MIELILFSALILLLVRHRFFWIARSRKLSSNNSPIIMAHRGITVKSPENTISSYKEAIEAGFNALELITLNVVSAARRELFLYTSHSLLLRD